MLQLALETSTAWGGVALAEDGALLAESTLDVRATHSETVLPEIDRLMQRCQRDVAALASVVVGAGPGSFTGVRIAASIAKGLCFARGLPLYAYSSLSALAAGTGLRGPVCAMFDARRGEVYAAAFRDAATSEVSTVIEPVAAPLTELLDRLEEPAEWSFVGEGAVAYAGIIEAAGGTLLPEELGQPGAVALLRLARTWPERGRVETPATWEPLYVRRSGAQRQAERAGS